MKSRLLSYKHHLKRKHFIYYFAHVVTYFLAFVNPQCVTVNDSEPPSAHRSSLKEVFRFQILENIEPKLIWQKLKSCVLDTP